MWRKFLTLVLLVGVLSLLLSGCGENKAQDKTDVKATEKGLMMYRSTDPEGNGRVPLGVFKVEGGDDAYNKKSCETIVQFMQTEAQSGLKFWCEKYDEEKN
jgi:hypothetical protein